jgi:segregation and condensation protein B
MTLDAKIEAYLFYKAEPISRTELSKFFSASISEVNEAIVLLETRLSLSGLSLIVSENEITLGTKAELGPLFEELRKVELSKELSKASLETLSIVLYSDGPSRADIDYIRGVNSGFILRNLLIRGLIEKKAHTNDSRRYVYYPSVDILSYLGVTKREELPRFEEIKNTLLNKIENQELAQN